MMKKHVIITVNWGNIKSIKTAERRKAYYENKGYTLTDVIPYMFGAKMIMDRRPNTLTRGKVQ